MRRSLAAAAVAMTAAAAATVFALANTSGSSDSPSGTATGQHATINVELPAWSTDAAGTYKGQITMPAGAKVVETLTGDNASTDQPTTYKPATIGNGMQVRFACNKKLLDDTVHYINFKVGTLDAGGLPQYNDDAPSDQVTGSWFFNFDWLAVSFDKPDRKPYIQVYGNCMWEIRLLTFPQQPLPNQ